MDASGPVKAPDDVVEVITDGDSLVEIRVQGTQAVEVAENLMTVEAFEAPAATIEVYADEVNVIDVVREPPTVIEVTQYEGAPGQQGPPGPPDGPPGPRGYSWHVGSGAPGAIAEARDGDLYVDLTDGTVFVFEEGAWASTGLRLRGADGASAYEIWLLMGHVGTEADFLASLKGDPGARIHIGTTAPDPALIDLWVDTN